jgi:hypothetical protein
MMNRGARSDDGVRALWATWAFVVAMLLLALGLALRHYPW